MSGDTESEDCTSTLARFSLNEKVNEELLDDEISDAMLGGLRRGMITIRNNAKDTLEKCKTDELRSEMEVLLKSSTIKLIRSEKSYLETARIVSQIVDEISSDFENDDTDEDVHQNIQNVHFDADAETSKRTSVVFRPTFANSGSIVNVAKRMATMFTDRIKNYEDSLTEVNLQNHPKFKALETQINLAETRTEQKNDEKSTSMLKGDGDGKAVMEEDDLESDDEFYDDADESADEVDFSIIPSVDPISRRPIQVAMKNKYCNHIFEDMSIREFIAVNPASSCPMYGCLNKRKLEHDHFIFDPVLNDRIREKHYASVYFH